MVFLILNYAIKSKVNSQSSSLELQSEFRWHSSAKAVMAVSISDSPYCYKFASQVILELLFQGILVHKNHYFSDRHRMV